MPGSESASLPSDGDAATAREKLQVKSSKRQPSSAWAARLSCPLIVAAHATANAARDPKRVVVIVDSSLNDES